jgi:uncharacterized membrane protein YpjA
MASRLGSVRDRLLSGDGLPDTPDHPWYVAPLPDWLENLGLNLAVPIAVVNLLGTAFGFWYYRFQFAMTDPVAWVFVPDSPVATLLIAASLLAWRAGKDVEWLHTLAFFGCLKLGFWTPFVQLIVNGGPGTLPAWLYWFLIVSHLAMTLEAFIIYRYASFPTWAVGVAAGWYWINDLVDYFIPFAGDLHHTLLRAEAVEGTYNHTLMAHDLAAAAAITLTLLATFLALATRTSKLRRSRPEG